MRFLEERGVGLDVRVARVPIVPTAALFDLGVGDPKARPGPDAGYAACGAASDRVPEGNVGAGTGATVAKHLGPQRAVKGGLGTASREEGRMIVGALAAVNSWGEVIDENGEVLAGAREAGGVNGAGADEGFGSDPSFATPTNTTLLVVATNATLSKERAYLLAQAAHEGLSAAIRPAHSVWDGDSSFALATGAVEGDQRALEALAIDAVSDAIRRAVRGTEERASSPHA